MFVWTIGDLIGFAFVAFFLMAVAADQVYSWIKHRRKVRKKNT